MNPRALILLAAMGAAAATFAVMLHRQYAADMRAAHSRLVSRSHIASTPCGPIEYAVAGHGPPLLMVHGAGGGFDQGLEFGMPLVRAGFSVIAPSRFGYLRTPLPRDASPKAQADAHACLLDVLGIEKVVALGGSAGAPSVVQLRLRHPGRCSAMILVVPALFPPNESATSPRLSRRSELIIGTTLRFDWLFWTASRFARSSMIESILATPIQDVEGAAPDERHRVFTILEHIQPLSRRSRGLWIDATVTTAPAQVEFERITIPTLVVSVANDRYGTLPGARVAAQRIQNARLIVYPNGGHVWVGHQSELWSEIVNFLKETSDVTEAVSESATHTFALSNVGE